MLASSRPGKRCCKAAGGERSWCAMLRANKSSTPVCLLGSPHCRSVMKACAQSIDHLAEQRNSVVISDLRMATIRQVPTGNVVKPVVKRSKGMYFISASIPPARFGEILSTGLPDGWITGLIGRDGRLIARSADQALLSWHRSSGIFRDSDAIGRGLLGPVPRRTFNYWRLHSLAAVRMDGIRGCAGGGPAIAYAKRRCSPWSDL